MKDENKNGNPDTPELNNDNDSTSLVATEETTVDNPDQFEDIGQTTVTARWSSVSGGSTFLSGTIEFSQQVSGVEPNDFEILNASDVAQTGWDLLGNQLSLFGYNPYRLRATYRVPPGTNGSFKIRLKANSVISPGSTVNDAPAGNVDTPLTAVNRPAAVPVTATWNTVAVQPPYYPIRARGGIGTLVATIVTGSLGNPINIASAFEVLDSSDTVQRGWTIRSVPALPAIGGSQERGLTIKFDIPHSTNGTFKIRLKANSLPSRWSWTNDSPTTNVDSSLITVDTRAITASAFWSNVSFTDGKLQGDLYFDSIVSHLDIHLSVRMPPFNNGDFEVVDNNNVTQTGWAFEPLVREYHENKVSVVAFPPTNTDGVFKLRLNQNSISGLYASSNNSPASDVDSIDIAVDNTSTSITMGWSNVSYSNDTGILQGTITFNQNLEGNPYQFVVVDSAGNSTTGWTVTWNYPGNNSRALLGGTGLTVIAIPPENTNGSFKLRLVANSARIIDSSTYPSGSFPSTNIDSSTISINNTAIQAPVAVTPTWGNVSYGITTSDTNDPIQVHGLMQSVLTFNQAINDLNYQDITIIDSDGNRVVGGTLAVEVEDFISIVPANTSLTITYGPPRNINKRIRFRLTQNSVRGPRSRTTNIPATNVDSNLINIDTRIVVVTATWSNVSYTNGKLQATLTFNGGIEGLFNEDRDIEVVDSNHYIQTGWRFNYVENELPPNIGVSIKAKPPANTNGSFKLVLKGHSVRNLYMEGHLPGNSPSNHIFSSSVSVDTTAVVATAAWSNTSYTNKKVQGTLTFNTDVTGISVNDFEILNASDVVQTGWTFDGISSFAPANIGIVIAVTPPRDTNASFKIRLKATSVRGLFSTTDNSPASAVVTGSISVDSRLPVVATAAWSAVSYCVTSGKLQGTLTFNENITEIAVSDFEILNASDVVQSTGWTFDPIPSTATANTGITISVTPPSNINASFKIRLKGTSVRGPNSLSDNTPASDVTTSATLVDSRPPIVATAAWSLTSYCTTSNKVQGTLTFNNAVTGITTSDFEILNSADAVQTGWTFDTPSTTAAANTGIIIRANPPNGLDANFKIRLKATSVLGPRASTANSPAANVVTDEISVDTRTVATAAWSNVSYTGGKLTGTLTFTGANITGIAADDFEVLTNIGGATTGWSFDTPSSSATAGTGITISATPPANTNASFSIRLKADSVVSGGGTNNNAPASAVITPAIAIDNRPPVVATAAWSSVSYTNKKLQGTLTFNNNVTGISSDDFAILNDSDVVQSTGWTFDSINTSAISGTGITIRANPPANLNADFKIRLKATSVLGPRASTANSPAANVDTAATRVDSRPAVATGAWSNLTGEGVLSGRMTFTGAAVTGITNADFEVLNASDQIQSTGWTISVSGSSVAAGGFVTVTASPSAITDASFKLRLKATSVRSDGSATDNTPVSAITSAATRVNSVTWNNVRFDSAANKIRANIRFTRGGTHISAIQSNDFQIINEAGQNQSWSIDGTRNLIGINRDLAVSATAPTDTNGRFALRMLARGARDNPSRIQVPINNTDSAYIAIDNRIAYPVATASWGIVTGGTGSSATLSSAITFSGTRVTGITNTDFEVTNANDIAQTGWSIVVTGGSSVAAGGSVTVTATPPANTNNDFKLRIKSESVRGGGSTYDNSPASATISASARVDSRPAPATASWSNISGGETLSGRINFAGYAVTNIDTTDFEVTNDASTPAVQTGWTIVVSGSTAAVGGFVTVTATPPALTNGSFRLRLKATSVRSDTSTSDNAPTSAVISSADTVDNLPIVATASWGSVTGGTGSSATLSSSITFSGAAITNIDTADFAVLNDSDVAQSNWTIVISSTTASNGGSVTVTATPPVDQNADFKLELKSISVRSDSSPVDNAPAAVVRSATARVDSRPIVATASWGTITGGSTLSGPITFSGAAVANIEAADFEVLNTSNAAQTIGSTGWRIAVSSSTATNGGSITVTATPPLGLNARFKLRIKATSVRSDSSTRDNAPATAVISSDAAIDSRPTVATASWGTVTYCSTSRKIESPLTFMLANITGIAADDFEIIDSTNTVHSWTFDTPSATATAGTPITIRATVPNNTLGSYRFRLKGTSVRSDGATSDNAPTGNVTSAAIQLDTRIIFTPVWTIAGGETLVGTLTFNNAAAFGITNTDFEVIDNTTPTPIVQTTGWNISVSAATAIAGGSITVTATAPANTNAMFALRLKARSLQSGAAGSNNAPTNAIASGYTTLDNIPVVATASWGTPSYSSATGKVQANLTFTGANVTNIEAADFEIINASNQDQGWTFDTPSATATAGTAITISAIVPSNISGPFRFRLKRSSVRSDDSPVDNAPAAASVSGSVSIDTRVRATGTWSNISGGTVLSGRMTFSGAPVSGIEEGDFRVLNDSDQVQSSWTIVVSGNSVSLGGFVTVTAAPNVAVNGNFKLRLNRNSVQSGSSGTNNAPNTDIISSSAAIDSRTFSVATAAWSDMTGDETLSGRITFSGAVVTGITDDDFEVLNASDVAQTGWTIAVSGSAVSVGGFITVTATPSDLIDADFKLRLKANSVRSDSSPANNAPALAVTSPAVEVNTVTWRTISYERTSRQIEGSIRFTGGSGTVSGIASTAFDILDENNVRQTGWTVNTPPSTATVGGDPIDITATSTTATPGLFKIRMKARTAQLTRTSRSQSGPSGQQSTQIPANNVDSDTTEIPFGMATVTIPQGSQGGIQIALKQRSFHVDGSPEQEGPPFQQYLGTVFYDTRTAEFFGRWNYASWCETSNKIIASITFNKAITGLNVTASSNLNGDIQILNERKDGRTPKQGWVFSFAGHTGTDLANASLAANTPLTMEITPPSNTYENVYLVFNDSQISYDSTETGPSTDLYTEVIAVDNRPADAIQVPVPAWTVPSGTQTGTTAEFGLRFVNTGRGTINVTGLEPDDFQITGISSGMVTISSLSWLITLSGDAVGLDETHITISSTPPNPVVNVAPFGTGNRTFMITLGRATSSLPANTVIINQTSYPGVTTSITEVQGNYFIDVPLPMNQSGIITLILRKNAVITSDQVRGPINDSSSGSVPFDTRPATPETDPDRSWALWTDLEGGTTLKGRLHFIGDAITGLMGHDPDDPSVRSDIDVVLHGTGLPDTNFTVSVSTDSVSAGQYVNVTATPSSTYRVDGSYRLRLKADSVMVGSETAPPENVDSNAIAFNTLLTWGAPTNGSDQAYIEAVLTFNSDFINIASSDFKVLDQTDQELNTWNITITPDVTTRSNRQTLTVRGTPPANKPVYDSFRLQLTANSISFSNRQTEHAPNNNLITDPILVATTQPPQPAENIPYLVSSMIPTSEVESDTVIVHLDAELNGAEQAIDGLRIEDIMITSPAGPVTFELLTRE